MTTVFVARARITLFCHPGEGRGPRWMRRDCRDAAWNPASAGM